MGGGQNRPCVAKFSEKCTCSHHNITTLIKQTFLFDAALVITNISKLLKRIITFNQYVGQHRERAQLPPPPHKIKEHFTPIRLGLRTDKTEL